MASVTRKDAVIQQVSPKQFILSLSEVEASLVMALVGACASMVGATGIITHQIYGELNNAGVPRLHTVNTPHGALTFR